MSNFAITADQLGKRYSLGRQKKHFATLRDQIAETVRGIGHSAKHLFGGQTVPSGKPADFWALRDLSLEIKHGEVVGLVGRNGAGKSTLLKILSRITAPTEGRATILGRVGSLLEVGTGFHPELTGRDNIFLNGAVLGMSKAEIVRKFDEIVAFAEIEKFLETPVKRYSSGMMLRLGFAVAAHLETEILIVDEVLAVGDYAFQRKCLSKMGDVARTGRTVLLVSHNMQAIRRLCNRTCILKNGRVSAFGNTDEVIQLYLSEANRQGLSLDCAALEDAGRPGRIRFVSFSASQAGAIGLRFRNDLSVSIRLEYELFVEQRGLRVGFDVFDAEAVLLFRSFCDDDQKNVREIQLPGKYSWETTLPGNWLRAGGYSVFLTATIHNIEWITLNQSAVGFEIIHSGGANIAYHDSRPGVVMPLLEWTCEIEAPLLTQ